MSRKKAAEENNNHTEGGASPAEKEKLSRLKKRHRKEARKKRRALIVLLLLLVCVLAVGAILDIPYINIAREAGSWISERFSSPQKDDEPEPDFLYFTHPQSAKELDGEVSVLLGIYVGEKDGQPTREILYLALFIYDRDAGMGEVYLIPETAVAYNAEGEQTNLKQALREEGGEDLLRSTVSNLAGTEVDYLLLMEFWEAAKLIQAMRLPAVSLEDQTVLVSPLNGETNFLVPGQEIKDADRLLFYHLATDELELWPAFSARLERAGAYVPEVLFTLRQVETEDLEGMVSSSGHDHNLEPGSGSAKGDSRYLASMLQSFAQLEESRLAVRAVAAVEILNGCGVPDLGKKVGERLGSLGVPVAGTGSNAKVTVDGEEINDFTHDVSTIIYRSENPRVEAFARYLGVLMSIEDVVSQPGPGPEIILIAGRDLAA